MSAAMVFICFYREAKVLLEKKNAQRLPKLRIW